MSTAKVQTVGRAASPLALLLCLAAAAFGQPSGASGRTSDEGLRERVHVGHYVNRRFGFGFVIPRGLRGVGAPDGFPQDGVVIKLPGGDVRVYGEYDGLLAGSPRAQARLDLKFARGRSSSVRLLRWRETRLGRLRAVRFAYEFREGSSPDLLICDHVIAYKRPEGGAGTFFNLELTTTRRRYAAGREAFERVLRSWREIPAR